MGCCAMGTCTDPRCYLCTVIAKLPVNTHPDVLRRYEKRAEPQARAPRTSLTKKRHRAGPMYVPAHRRV